MWFQTEVLFSRAVSSVLWHLILQSVFVQAYLFTYQTVSWHPATGINMWLSKLFSSTSLVYHFFLNMMTVFFACLHARNYSVQQSIPITRLQTVWNFVHPQRLIHLIILSFSGSVVIFCFTQLLGGKIANLRDPCDGDCSTSGINGQHLFLLLYGIYAGAVYSLKYFRDGCYLVRLPIIQQMKFLTIKSRIPEILANSVVQVLKNLHWYYAIYFIFGSYPKHWLSIIFDAQNSSNTFNEIFNLNLLLITIGSGTTLYFIWTLYLCLFDVFITERHEFLIKATLEGEKEKILSKVMTYTNFDTSKYLAFLDLRMLAQNSPSRRLQLFSISQPGGHPYQWEAVSSVCLSTLENFLCKLNELSTAAMSNAAKLPAVQTPITGTPICTSRSGLTMSSSFASPSLSSCGPVDRMQFSSSIRPGSITDSGLGIANYLITSLKKIQEAVRKKPVVAYFLNELPDAQARRLFSSCQPVIWTIEALSFLISASYKEDRYGVVQQSFPQILCLLIDLKLSEEKLQLGTISVKRHGKESSSLQKETLLRHSLKSALNSSLYRIVTTFNKHINGVHVPEEYHRHIKRYSDFKE